MTLHPRTRMGGAVMNRRDAILAGLGGMAAVLAACGDGFDPTGPRKGNPRLTARPGPPTGSIAAGQNDITLPSGRATRIIVPQAYTPAQQWPLALMLHGAGSNASGILSLFRSFVDTHGIIIMAVSSFDGTWDAVGREFGVDVATIDEALAAAFARCAVDPARVGIEGFSDGATYALALGRANGDLFTRIASQSPGFIFPLAEVGSPDIYLTHGVFDPVFPIDETGAKIAAALSARYDVRYEEYDGGHELPSSVASGVLAWLAETP